VYVTFLRVASADTLYQRAEAMLKSDQFEVKKEAREGPIADFLRAYPNDSRFEKIQGWANKFDMDLLDEQMQNRRRTNWKQGVTDEEKLYRHALELEDAGKLTDAKSNWNELSQRKVKTDPEQKTWGLLAERYLEELDRVEPLYEGLKNLKVGPTTDDLDKKALLAIQHERARDQALQKATLAERKYDTAMGRVKEAQENKDEKEEMEYRNQAEKEKAEADKQKDVAATQIKDARNLWAEVKTDADKRSERRRALLAARRRLELSSPK
jgi:hypothetical protein